MKVLKVFWRFKIKNILNKMEYEHKKSVGPILYLRYKNKKWGICFCHKKQERTINFLGFEHFFCSRCLGIFFGGVVGAFLHFLGYHILFVLFILLTFPLLIDGFSQYLGLRESNNMLRLITGALFGISLNYVGVMI